MLLLSLLKNVFSTKKNFTRQKNVVNSSILSEIEINLIKKKTIEIINVDEKTTIKTITTTTKNIIRTLKTKTTMMSTKFTSLSISIF